MSRPRFISIALGLALVFGVRTVGAQTTGCCVEPLYCVNNLDQAGCDLTYTSGSAGSNFYSGQTCDQVSVCTVMGKCIKTDGTSCSDLKKWQCDDLYQQSYKFFQGQTCAQSTSSTGTCCIQNPPAGGSIPFCEPDIDPQICTGSRQGRSEARSCNLVPDCPQAVRGSADPSDAQAPPSPVVFDPEIEIPFFSGGVVSGTTFAQYLRAIFIGFIWSVGVLAVVMVIFGGVKWVAAAGNPARINVAKDVVFNAIIGLVIALTSVVLLSLLDPNLANFRGLSATTEIQVKPIPYENDYALGENNEGLTCKTRGGNLVQEEASCFFPNTRLIWPVTGVTQKVPSDDQRVGPRDLTVGSKCHPGTDFSTDKSTGQHIVAPTNGTITAITPSPQCGEYTMVLQTDAFYIRFVHVKVSSRQIGDKVSTGELIGYTGGDPKDSKQIASCSGGPHLHVELYANDKELHDIYPCIQQ